MPHNFPRDPHQSLRAKRVLLRKLPGRTFMNNIDHEKADFFSCTLLTVSTVVRIGFLHNHQTSRLN